MRTKRKFVLLVLAFAAVLLGGGTWFWSAYPRLKHEKLVNSLRAGQLDDARERLNGEYDWARLLQMIEQAHDPALVQAAFDVQFEPWYHDDTNYDYPEHSEVIARLLGLGAKPTFKHLRRATLANHSKNAWLLLKAGVPASPPTEYLESGSKTPLAHAAYWGDLPLVAELLRRGADVNQGSRGGNRPLLSAAWSGQVETVRFLLGRGADVSLPYEGWDGKFQPLWKIVEERARGGGDAAAVWQLIRERVPAAELKGVASP